MTSSTPLPVMIGATSFSLPRTRTPWIWPFCFSAGVVQEADRLVAVRENAHDLPHQHLTGIPGAEDEHALSLLVRSRSGARVLENQLAKRAAREPCATDCENAECEVEDEDRARKEPRLQERPDRRNEDRRDRRRLHELHQVARAGVPPEPVKEADSPVDERARDQRHGQKARRDREDGARRRPVEAQQERHAQRQRPERDMQRDNQRASMRHDEVAYTSHASPRPCRGVSFSRQVGGASPRRNSRLSMLHDVAPASGALGALAGGW